MIYGCPFLFAFKSEFNSTAEVLALQVLKNNISPAAMLALDTI